jgi:DNA invertase Pin-like site-specific DNA recombinase
MVLMRNTPQATKPLHPAVYLRQSKDDQLGIARQREDTLAFCEREHWPAPQIYEDDGKSASNGKSRPEYDRLLADIRARKVDAVVVAQLDRLHRQPIELEEFMALADDPKHRVALKCASGGDVDLGTDDGRFMARVIGAVARKEMERKSWRQKQAAEQRAEMGEQWWSVRPFGYEREPIVGEDGKQKVNKNGTPLWKPVVEPCEAGAIRDAYSAVLGGTSLYSITQQWNERRHSGGQGCALAGVPAEAERPLLTPRGNRWRGTQVRAVLLSARNAGLRSFRGKVLTYDDGPHKGERIKGNWDAIVTEDMWDAVVDKLSNPGRRTGLSRARKYLLSGIATCGLCGSVMASGVTHRPRQTPIYTCKGCNRVSRNAAQVDALAVEAVITRLSRPNAAELTITAECDDLDEYREKARALVARRDSVGIEFADGELSASQLRAINKRIDEQLEQIDKVIRDAQKTHVFDGVIGVPDVDAAFDALDLGRKRAIVAELVAVTILPAERGRNFDHRTVKVVPKGPSRDRPSSR